MGGGTTLVIPFAKSHFSSFQLSANPIDKSEVNTIVFSKSEFAGEKFSSGGNF
jgi:hypothetical protein